VVLLIATTGIVPSFGRYSGHHPFFTLAEFYQRVGRAVLRGILLTPKWPVISNYTGVCKLLIVKTGMLTEVIWSESILADS